jgi:23S rRNA (adenine2503-C2)-methyltransferase
MSADPSPTPPISLFGLDRDALIDYCTAQGEKPFRAEQLLKWLYHQRVTSFDEMSNISKKFRAHLHERCSTELPQLKSAWLSVDGTRKWLLELRDGALIEMVNIPEEGRNTLCISTQVGCAQGCKVCATAQLGLTRNLTVDEIIAQVWLAVGELAQHQPDNPQLTNVVMMGMGEPLLNFDAVMRACRLIQDDLAFGISKRKLTISTVGIAPAIAKLKEHTDVSLAVSLHAPRNDLRTQLLPINQYYPLEQLIPACRDYVRRKSHRMITWEYVMLEGVNDTPREAKELLRLIEGIPSKINLIPFNPFPGSPFRCSSEERIARFTSIIKAAGLTITTRKSRGADILAACGQLVAQEK